MDDDRTNGNGRASLCSGLPILSPGQWSRDSTRVSVIGWAGLAIGPIDAHIDIVVNGKAGSAMQAFAAQLNPAEIAAVVTYERNAWGNNVGDLVQPRAVNALISSEE